MSDSTTNVVKAPKLTQEQYVELGGNYCPHCAERTVRVEKMHPQASFQKSRKAHCSNCGQDWRDQFNVSTRELIGYK
jgi:transposase-like protein